MVRIEALMPVGVQTRGQVDVQQFTTGKLEFLERQLLTSRPRKPRKTTDCNPLVRNPWLPFLPW